MDHHNLILENLFSYSVKKCLTLFQDKSKHRQQQKLIYTIILENNGTDIDIDLNHIYNTDSVPASGNPSISLGFFQPEWMKHDQKVTPLLNNKYRAGYLNLNKDNYLEFVRHGSNGQITQRNGNWMATNRT